MSSFNRCLNQTNNKLAKPLTEHLLNTETMSLCPDRADLNQVDDLGPKILKIKMITFLEIACNPKRIGMVISDPSFFLNENCVVHDFSPAFLMGTPLLILKSSSTR